MLRPKTIEKCLSLIAVVFIICFCRQSAFASGQSWPCSRQHDLVLMPADTIPVSCPKSIDIEKIINEAISLGAPIYNEGLHMACYRVYEWASYKILYEYGKQCKEVEKTLKAAIEKSHGDYSDTEKAWIMRVAFDKILGEPTRTDEPQKGQLLNKG